MQKSYNSYNKYRTYRVNNAKEKKARNKLGESLTPTMQSFCYIFLGLDTNQANLFFERKFPLNQVVCFCIKDNSIAGGPNDPASCNDNLFEDRIIEVYSCLADHIQRFKRSVPENIEIIPASNTKRACEKKMEAGLF
jgi:hypothetical protein